MIRVAIFFPICPKGTYDIWVRGYGWSISPKVKAQPGKTVDLKSVQALQRARRRAVLSGHLLVRDDEDPPANLFPEHRPAGQRHVTDPEGSGPVAPLHPRPRCGHCHQLGDLMTRAIRTGRSAISTPAPKPGNAACNPAKPDAT
jgi:hypothetical protein